MRDKTGSWLAFNGQCAYCRDEEMVGYDHVIPVSEGGETAPYNMLPCCAACNSSKGDEEVVSWLCYKGWDDRWPGIEEFLKTSAERFSTDGRHLVYK